MLYPDRVEAFEELFERLPQLRELNAGLHAALRLMEDCARGGHKLLICGNGGSAADAEHMAAELMKSFVYRRPVDDQTRTALAEHFGADAVALSERLEAPIAAIALGGQLATLTAYANDVDYRYALAQLVYGLGQPGDVLIAISTSGNSPNVVHACQVARARGLPVLGLTGQTGGRMHALCDVALCAPATLTHLVQELHLPLYHALCLGLEERMFSQHGKRA